MMTLEMPTLLALLGTALMAVAIFAPRRAIARAAASPALTFSPLVEHRLDSPQNDVSSDARDERQLQEPAAPDTLTEESSLPSSAGPSSSMQMPTWPLLVDSRAAACDAAARWEIVDALAAVRAPWAEAILVRALDDEPDSDVRNAVRAALAA